MVTKQVTCDGCGRPYQYELERTVIGKSSKSATTQAEADAQAVQDADAKLAARLASDCDLVAWRWLEPYVYCSELPCSFSES